MNIYKVFSDLVTMVKIGVPQNTFETVHLLDIKRSFPSLDCLTREQFDEVRKRTSQLLDFHSKSKLAYQAVDYLGNFISERGFKEIDCFDDSPTKDKKFFYKDPWQKSSMVVVNQGAKPLTEGFRLIISHVDAPCLRVKPRPFHVELPGTVHFYDHLGVRLSTIPHGGVVVPYWMGQQVKVMGYTIDKNRQRREITFPGIVGVNSAHSEAFESILRREFSPENSLEIIVGHSGISGFLETIGINSMDDFVNSRFWAVPTNEMSILNEDSLNLLVGYGHDNRTTAFSAVDAITKVTNQKYSSIVWIVDNEEIFDPAPAGSSGNFLETIFEKMLKSQEKKENRKISVDEKNAFYNKSRLITGDVTFSPYGYDAAETDHRSAAKIGLGTSIEGGDIQGYNPLFIRDLRTLAESTSNKIGVCHQITGQFYSQDEMNLWYSRRPQSSFPGKGVSDSWVAIPCACLHSLVEVICPGDEYATSELYKRFFKSPVSAF